MVSSKRNQKQRDFLRQTLENERFHHAYLFAGEDPEKTEIALDFAKRVLNIEQGFNPDLLVLKQDKIKIEDIRNLIKQLSFKPYQSSKKIAIIENFETATEESFNAILKTLEEPYPNTIIILLASTREKLLSTILSRVQTINFGAAVFTEELLEDRDKESLVKYREIRERKIAERLAAIKDFSEFENSELQKFFRAWLADEQEYLRKGQTKRFKNAQLLSEAMVGLQKNFNKKMVLEKLFLNLA